MRLSGRPGRVTHIGPAVLNIWQSVGRHETEQMLRYPDTPGRFLSSSLFLAPFGGPPEALGGRSEALLGSSGPLAALTRVNPGTGRSLVNQRLIGWKDAKLKRSLVTLGKHLPSFGWEFGSSRRTGAETTASQKR
ncbi:unnamed protein product [Lota lota]